MAENLTKAELVEAVAKAVSIPVFGVGGVRSLDDAESLLAKGASLVGVGRPFYTEPDLAKRMLQGARARCSNCNQCVVAQMLGLPGQCYNPAVRAPLL